MEKGLSDAILSRNNGRHSLRGYPYDSRLEAKSSLPRCSLTFVRVVCLIRKQTRLKNSWGSISGLSRGCLSHITTEFSGEGKGISDILARLNAICFDMALLFAHFWSQFLTDYHKWPFVLKFWTWSFRCTHCHDPTMVIMGQNGTDMGPKIVDKNCIPQPGMLTWMFNATADGWREV